MTLLFQKSNFCGNFSTFLEVSKLLITNYFLNITHRQGADHHSSQSVCDDVAVLALSRCNTGLAALMLDFQSIKTVCV